MDVKTKTTAPFKKPGRRHFIAISTGSGKTDTHCICYCSEPFCGGCKVTDYILSNLDDTEEIDSDKELDPEYSPDSPEFDLTISHC